jgi:hypothetical protein
MAINYAKMRDLAKKLIDQNGQSVTFFQKGGTLSDPTKPWKGTSAPDRQITVIAVIIPNKELDDPQEMRRGKAMAYVAQEDFGDGSPFAEAAVEGFDRMVDADGIEWDVHGLNIINPGGIRVMYEIILEH